MFSRLKYIGRYDQPSKKVRFHTVFTLTVIVTTDRLSKRNIFNKGTERLLFIRLKSGVIADQFSANKIINAGNSGWSSPVSVNEMGLNSYQL